LAAIVHLVFSRARLWVGEIYRNFGLGEVEYGSWRSPKWSRYGTFIRLNVKLAKLLT
jgi:hypothetical protein